MKKAIICLVLVIACVSIFLSVRSENYPEKAKLPNPTVFRTYKILTESNLYTFETLVANALSEGYNPLGGAGWDGKKYFQAVAR